MNDHSKRTILNTKTVPGYYPSKYATERVFVKSRDGLVDIPNSMVYRKDVMDQHVSSTTTTNGGGGGGEPLSTLLYGYGSYGFPMDASFFRTKSKNDFFLFFHD